MRRAIECYEQGVTIMHEVGDRHREGSGLGNLGIAYHMVGNMRKAIVCYEQALAIAHDLGDRRGEEDALCNLGNVYRDLGKAWKTIELRISWNFGLYLEQQDNLVRAAELMQVYVDFLSETEHPGAEKRAAYVAQIRQRLAASQSTTPAEKPAEE